MLAVTKLDVLDTFDTIRIATGYELDGTPLRGFPDSVDELERVQPVYDACEGWNVDTGECRSLAELPLAARAYLARLEEESDTPIRLVSVGASRREIIRMDEAGAGVAV